MIMCFSFLICSDYTKCVQNAKAVSVLYEFVFEFFQKGQ